MGGLSERDVRKLGKHREVFTGFEELGEIANTVADPPPGSKKELDEGGGHSMKGKHDAPVQPVATPTMPTISFAAIQHSQAQAEQGGPVKDNYYLQGI